MKLMARLIEWLSRLFGGAAFPAFAVTVLLCYEAALIALAFWPAADAGFGAFAAEFRIWCLGADPATGRPQWGYAIGMISPPLFVAMAVAWLWRAPLLALRSRPRAATTPLLAALAVVISGACAFLLADPRPAQGELPFPAEALRTTLPPPPIRLTDQTGATVDIADFRGKVVLLTAIYSSCSRTCPMIVAQAKRVVSELSRDEQSDLRVLAVTLDPMHDTPQVLAAIAAAQELEAPLWHLVTGESSRVERSLDLMNVARARDPKTGQIDHANLFLLVDRSGRLAYRFTLGERQERWLSTAIRLLLREPGRV